MRRILLEKWLLAVWGRKGSGGHLNLNLNVVGCARDDGTTLTQQSSRGLFPVSEILCDFGVSDDW